METAEGFYKCPDCGRSYKSISTPDKCAVCGADSGGRVRPGEDRNAASVTDKFRLAASRAKGNF